MKDPISILNKSLEYTSLPSTTIRRLNRYNIHTILDLVELTPLKMTQKGMNMSIYLLQGALIPYRDTIKEYRKLQVLTNDEKPKLIL